MFIFTVNKNSTMKKILSTVLLTATVLAFGQAQVVINENFETLTLGNVGSDTTGATAGQGGMYIFGGTAADFQIVNIDASNGKSLRVTSGNGYATPNNTFARYVWKNITTMATAANNIVLGTAKFHTGPATGAGRFQLVLYDSTTTGIVGIAYDYATKQIKGLGRLIQTSTSTPGFYTLNLGTQTFAANTWVTVQFTYNKTTGAYGWAYTDGTTPNTGSYGLATAPTGYTLVTGMVPAESDVVNSTLTGNTVANSASADSWSVQFTNQGLLSVEDTKPANLDKASITVYPNPASDVLNIKSESKINKVAVTDLAGKNVNVRLNGNSLDVRHLPTGTYFISVETKDGFVTEKFIKK